jgi:DNA-binding response OmpR family regulator
MYMDDRGGHMNIALLEDDLSNLEYLVTLLQFKGHLVFPHADAASFLDTLWATTQDNDLVPLRVTIDLAILDILLPSPLSGLDILHMLRETGTSYSHLPIIVISGASQSTLNDVHRQFPTVPILRKPFQIQELFSLIDDISAT